MGAELGSLSSLLPVLGPASASRLQGVARAFLADPEYRALVCVFLVGGSDGNSMLIPVDDAGYGYYRAARPRLAVPQSALIPLSQRQSGGRTWALHPLLSPLRELFEDGRAAVVANVGPLIQPTSKEQYGQRSVPLPSHLFSHSRQQRHWQAGIPEDNGPTGWGGRMVSLLEPPTSGKSPLAAVSLGRTNHFQVGHRSAYYVISPDGAAQLAGRDAEPGTAEAILAAAQEDIFAQAWPRLIDANFAALSVTSMRLGTDTNSLLATTPPLRTKFPEHGAARDLRMVARLIAAGRTLGLKRQVFFVACDGWDTHAEQSRHSDALLRDLSSALGAFHAATVELGVDRQVTAFTASDFGRTFVATGDGTDHGWGNHHFVIGGAVKGGQIYGRMPDLAPDSADDIGGGRWLPSTSVTQYAATLAAWFGVPREALGTLFPNLRQFAGAQLGFL